MLERIRTNNQFSESELKQIDEAITDFYKERIELDKLLSFLEIQDFRQEFISKTEAYDSLVTLRESVIASLFNLLLKPLFEYEYMQKWENLRDYVNIVYSKNRSGRTSIFTL